MVSNNGDHYYTNCLSKCKSADRVRFIKILLVQLPSRSEVQRVEVFY